MQKEVLRLHCRVIPVCFPQCCAVYWGFNAAFELGEPFQPRTRWWRAANPALLNQGGAAGSTNTSQKMPMLRFSAQSLEIQMHRDTMPCIFRHHVLFSTPCPVFSDAGPHIFWHHAPYFRIECPVFNTLPHILRYCISHFQISHPIFKHYTPYFQIPCPIFKHRTLFSATIPHTFRYHAPFSDTALHIFRYQTPFSNIIPHTFRHRAPFSGIMLYCQILYPMFFYIMSYFQYHTLYFQISFPIFRYHALFSDTMPHFQICSAIHWEHLPEFGQAFGFTLEKTWDFQWDLCHQPKNSLITATFIWHRWSQRALK